MKIQVVLLVLSLLVVCFSTTIITATIKTDTNTPSTTISNGDTTDSASSIFKVRVGGFSSVDELKQVLEKHVKPPTALYSSFDVQLDPNNNVVVDSSSTSTSPPTASWIVSLHNEKQVEILAEIINSRKTTTNTNNNNNNYFLSKLYNSHQVVAGERMIQKTNALLSYHNYASLTAKLNALNAQYSNMTSLFSIGKSVQNRDLWVIKISSNTTIGVPSNHSSHYQKPKFKYVANMHGDETVGREVLLYFTEYLLQQYANNSRIRNIIDYMDVYLLPSMNPDGFELNQRENANGVDLNRDFPDQFVTTNSQSSHQVETTAIMNWIQSENFVLSANFHGGAVVASYPYDSAKGAASGASVASYSHDDAFFKLIAKGYADAHTTMKNSFEFPGGYINGAYWYVLFGGMQDFNYWKKNCFEITVELSDTKYPAQSTLDTFWNQNRESLLTYMEFLRYSIVGIVTDSKGNPIPNAVVTVEGNAKTITTFDNGVFFRLLPPGNYQIKVTKDNYLSITQSVSIYSNATLGNPTFAHFRVSSAPPSYSIFASSSYQRLPSTALKQNSIVSMASAFYSVLHCSSRLTIVVLTFVFTILYH